MSTAKMFITDMPTGLHRLEYYAIDRAGNRSVGAASFIIPKTFNVKNYGARGDGITDDTQAIRNAIEAARAGSGTGIPALIYFPAGTYRIRRFFIHSNMYLKGDGINRTKLVRFVDRSGQMETFTGTSNGETITISTNLFSSGTFEPFPSPVPEDHPIRDESGRVRSIWAKSFIANYNIKQGDINMGIMDMTINGSGYEFNVDPNRHTSIGFMRAEGSNTYTVSFYLSRNIFFNNIRVEDSMNWTVSCEACSNIHVGYMEIDGNTQWPNRLSDRPNQDGLNLKNSNTIFIDRLILYETFDSGLALESVGRGIPVYNVSVNYIEAYRHIQSGNTVAIVHGANAGEDVHDVYIKHIKIHARNTDIINTYLGSRERGSHANKFVRIGAVPYPTTIDRVNYGRTYNIRIDKIEVTGFSHEILPYDFQTGEERTTGAGTAILSIASTIPGSGITSPYKVSNVQIGEVTVDYQMQSFTGSEYHGQFGIVIHGAEDVTVSKIHSINKSSKISDLRIFDSNNIRIGELYIRRVNGGGASLITVNNSQNILLDNVTVPYVSDGSNSKHATALRIEGNARNVTLRYHRLETIRAVEYIDVPAENLSSIVLQPVS